MRFEADTRELYATAAQLNGAGDRIRKEWAQLAFDIGEQAVGYIKTEFRSGPTSASTTQVRTNRGRQAYASRVKRQASGVDLDVGLIKLGVDAKTLGYMQLMEGFNADGSRFTSKPIRAKGDGYLTFPIYDPNTPGTAKGNIKRWARVKEVTFRPRPSLDAAVLKFQPIMAAEAAGALVRAIEGRP